MKRMKLDFQRSIQKDIDECWQIYLGECCAQCKIGNTADCDVNPLRVVNTRERAVDILLYMGLVP